MEVRCPQTGWLVPLLPSRILSFGKKAIAELVPVSSAKRYDIIVRSGVSAEDLTEAAHGTLRSDGRGQDPYLIHTVAGRDYRTKIATLRGDFRDPETGNGNRLRLWEKRDFTPRNDDIFQERIYAIHWMKPKSSGKKFDYKFTGVSKEDLERERIVERYVEEHFDEWQENGWIPDMRIEPGDKTDEPIRTRGWTHWHHLFPPRHLMILGLLRKEASNGEILLRISRILDYTSKLCRWTTSKAGSSKPGEGGRTGGASDNPANVFYNQVLNTFYNYGCRASRPLLKLFGSDFPAIDSNIHATVSCRQASELADKADIFITDPPYGDAVK